MLDYSVEEAVSKDLVLFKFKRLEAATSSFSATNKLGQGGFGPVYKVLIFTGTVLVITPRRNYNAQDFVFLLRENWKTEKR